MTAVPSFILRNSCNGNVSFSLWKFQGCPNSSAEAIHLSSRYYQVSVYTVFMRNCYSGLRLQIVNCRKRHELLLEYLDHVTFDVIIWPGAKFKKDHGTEICSPPRLYQDVSSIQHVSPSKPKFSHFPIRSSVKGELANKQNSKISAWNVISRSQLTA
jgi:hypothetical protein